MPDFDNIQVAPQQVTDALAVQKPIETPDYNVGVAKIFTDHAIDAINHKKKVDLIEAQAKAAKDKEKEDDVNAITDIAIKKVMPNASLLDPKYAEKRTQILNQVKGSIDKTEQDQADLVDKKFASMPNGMFGFGEDSELKNKVEKLRNSVYENADQATQLAPDWMRPNATKRIIDPFEAALHESVVNKLWNVLPENTHEETKSHFLDEAKSMYKNTDPQFVQKEADRMYKDYIIHKAKTENPDDFKDEGFTKYIDDKGNPTLQLKKDAWKVAKGDPTKLADATKQLLDYESGNFQSAKSRNQENYQQIQNMLASEGGGIPYVLQRAVSGVLDAADPEIAAAKALTKKGVYGENLTKERLKQIETQPMSFPVNTEHNPFTNMASDLAYGLTNMMTRAVLAKSAMGETPTVAKDYVTGLIKDAPNFGKVGGLMEQALKSSTVSNIASATDRALEMSKIFGLPTYNANIEKYTQLGYNQADATKKALRETMASMYIYSVMSHEPEGAQQHFERLLNPEERGLFQNIKTIGKGAFTSGSAMAANSMYEDYAQEGDKFNLHNSLAKGGKAFVQGAVFDLAMKGLNPQQLLSKNPQSDALAYFMQDRQSFQDEMERRVQSGDIKPQEALEKLKAMNVLQPHFQDGLSKGLNNKAAAQYAAMKAKYDLIGDALAQIKKQPEIDNAKLQDLQKKRADTAKDLVRIMNGTYLSGKVISGEEMAQISGKNKPESQSTNMTTAKKKLIIRNAPFVQQKVPLADLKTDDNVFANLKILENKTKLQHNVTEWDKLNEELQIINEAHNEIKGVRSKVPLSEKNTKRIADIRKRMNEIDDSVEPLGGIKGVRDMINYNDDANNGHIVVGKEGQVLDGAKQVATRLFNGDKAGSVVRSLTDAEKANLAQKNPSPEIKEDLGIVDEVDMDAQYNERKKSIEDKLNQQLEDNKDWLDDIEDKGGTKTVRQKIYQEHTNDMVELEKWKMKEDLKKEDLNSDILIIESQIERCKKTLSEILSDSGSERLEQAKKVILNNEKLSNCFNC